MTVASKTLRPSKLKTIALFVVSLVFTAGGILLIGEEGLIGWMTAIFFGLCSLVFFLQFLPNSTYLKLTTEGFEMRTLFRSRFTAWDQVRTFRVGHIGPNKGVVFDYSFKHQKNSTGKKLSKFLGGNEGGLPDTYGLKAAELAALMNEWKGKKIATTQSQTPH